MRRLYPSLALVALLTSSIPSLTDAADSHQLPTIAAASISGDTTNSSFALHLDSDTPTDTFTTRQVLNINLTLKPDASDIGRTGSVYVIFVKNNTFFLLNSEGHFSVWNGAVETLSPFSENNTFSEDTSVKLLSGRLDEPGEYQVFIGYATGDITTLNYTPSPFIFQLDTATESPFIVAALAHYESELESGLVQSQCIACHVTGGLARNSDLVFQRTMTGSELNNLNVLKSYLAMDGNSAETLLTTASGSNSHPGGQQIREGDENYQSLSQVLELLDQELSQSNEILSYTFDPVQPDEIQSGGQTLLSSIMLESREATLRRASILFTGKAPAPEELRIVKEGDDDTLRESIRSLMSSAEFSDFLVRASNYRLLIEGAADETINSNFGNLIKLRTLAYEIQISEGPDAWHSNYGRRIREASMQAAGELIAHVITNELPYSEILTARYMMMNPLLNEVLGGTATFPAGAGDEDFLPAKITQYYPRQEFEQTEKHPVAGLQIISYGKPLADYPHAGILSDFGFLARYPTTATNRNRARARWTLYHFLGIDIEKSSQRPTDEAALTDRNNPTLNNPACTVCHAVIDPVAGAFQNWSDFNYYRQDNGIDSLDRFYKHPPDGSASPYREGDLWYRDMRAPGLFEKTFTSRDYTLRELADSIVEEPGFLRATAQFWWPAIFGSKPIELPAVESDQGFAEKNAAYLAQQSSIDEFAEVLAEGMNAKTMLVEMVMSPWFSADTVTNYEFQAAHFESNLGSEQLLTPEQIALKTMNLTGVHWRTTESPDGSVFSFYDNLVVLLGGIDAMAVTERATLLTPTMTSILQSHAAETACPIVVKDLALPLEKRRLFLKVDETITPLSIAYKKAEVTATGQKNWQEHNVLAEIPAHGAEVNISFTNPWCDWNGKECVEQRVLTVDALTLRASDGSEQRFEASAPEIQISGEHCYINGTDATFFSGCTLSLMLDLDAASEMNIVAHLAGQQAPSANDFVMASIEVLSTANILEAETSNARLIKQQITELFQALHGKSYAEDSSQVQQTYSLFSAALTKARASTTNSQYTCLTYTDGRFFPDLLTSDQLAKARSASPNGNYYEYDWEYTNQILGDLTLDPSGTKRAWSAVIAYMLGHYDYIHE